MPPAILSLFGLHSATSSSSSPSRQSSSSNPSSPYLSTFPSPPLSSSTLSPTSTFYSLSSEEHNAWYSTSENDHYLDEQHSDAEDSNCDGGDSHESTVQNRRVILLLGAPQSGKSTLLKQLVLHHGSDASMASVRDRCRSGLYCKIIKLVREALTLRDECSSDYEGAISRMRLAPVLALESGAAVEDTCSGMSSLHGTSGCTSSYRESRPLRMDLASHILSALAKDIESLLSSSGIAIDSYLLSSLYRICSQDFVPSREDILRFSFDCVGIEEYDLDLTSSGQARLCDISKSLGKRPIWSRFFEDAACIFFVIDASAFDKPSGTKSNELGQAFRQLDKIRRDPLLRRVHICVIFNKCDLLKLKVKRGVMFKDYMRDFQGPSDSYRAVVGYLKQRVEKLALDDRPRTALGAHLRMRRIVCEVVNSIKNESIQQLAGRLQSLLEEECDRGNEGLKSFLHF